MFFRVTLMKILVVDILKSQAQTLINTVSASWIQSLISIVRNENQAVADPPAAESPI